MLGSAGRDASRDVPSVTQHSEDELKAIRPLFLDALEQELASCKGTRQLEAFHDKLAGLRVMDPACGCGNFLVIAYRELRRLELEALQRLHKSDQLALDVSSMVRVDVDQFHGIEIEEFPSQIAQVALWLTDHQMNMRVSEAFGQYFARLPLRKAPNIVHDNALRLDWKTVIAPERLSYIVGNPPFIGAKFLQDEQRAEMAGIFSGVKNAGLLDYVMAWYRKAVDYMGYNPSIRTAFVSTNSITQGEQVGLLWPDLLVRGVKLHFAHRTFQWSSEARGRAAVHCVIVGFGLQDAAEKWIYDYEAPKAEPHAIRASRINPYMVDAPDVVLANRSRPLCDVPEIGIGNKPIDGGHYLFTTDERDVFIAIEPNSAKWFRRWLGADEFLNGYERWCLWLGDCPPDELRRMPEAMKRVEAVKQFRLASKSGPTRKLAETPTRFHVENMPTDTFLLIPEVSSERRHFIPIGFMQPDTLCSNLVKIIPHARLYHFGILQSTMHNAWMRVSIQPPHLPLLSWTRYNAVHPLSGSSSSMRLLGQVGSFSKVFRSQAAGSMPLRRAVPSRVWMAAARCPACSEPANSPFFLPMAMGRMAFSTGLLSMGASPDSA